LYFFRFLKGDFKIIFDHDLTPINGIFDISGKVDESLSPNPEDGQSVSSRFSHVVKLLFEITEKGKWLLSGGDPADQPERKFRRSRTP
jgi:hypothetical protein